MSLNPSMISVDEALAQVLSSITEVCFETIALSKALNRVLAKDIVANLTQPAQDVSAMDGYAVQAEDLTTLPSTLAIIGESPAGGCFEGNVGPRQAVRIFTGAPVPKGTDSIIIQENTSRDGDMVTILHPVQAGRYIRPKGLDFMAGKTLIKARRKLTPRDLGLAAAANVPWLSVRRKPVIGIIATGNEVVMPGEPLGENQIISSNSILLTASIQSWGGDVLNLGIARDDEDALQSLISSAQNTDMLITIGGASVGKYDLVNKVLDKEGMDLGFYRVAMRPGKPLIFGHLKGTPVLGLPGNPVSVGVTSTLFLKPAIQAMLGLETTTPLSTARLAVDLPENDQRQDYLRATLDTNKDGEIFATPFGKQDSAMLARFAQAQALIIRPPHAPALKAGDVVNIIML